jgi:hypothetical protein
MFRLEAMVNPLFGVNLSSAQAKTTFSASAKCHFPL